MPSFAVALSELCLGAIALVALVAVTQTGGPGASRRPSSSPENRVIEWIRENGGEVRCCTTHCSTEGGAGRGRPPPTTKHASAASGGGCLTSGATTNPTLQVHFRIGRECSTCLRGALASRTFAAGDLVAKVPFTLAIALDANETHPPVGCLATRIYFRSSVKLAKGVEAVSRLLQTGCTGGLLPLVPCSCRWEPSLWGHECDRTPS